MQKFIEQKQEELLRLAKTEDNLYLSEIYTTFLADAINEAVKLPTEPARSVVQPEVSQAASQAVPEPNLQSEQIKLIKRTIDGLISTNEQVANAYKDRDYHPYTRGKAFGKVEAFKQAKSIIENICEIL